MKLTQKDFLTQLLAPPVKRTAQATRKIRGHGEGGQFEGKLGSMKRSRKGRTYHAPNGYIKYIPTIDEWKALGLCGGREKQQD